jgi:hypothetical protein
MRIWIKGFNKHLGAKKNDTIDKKRCQHCLLNARGPNE